MKHLWSRISLECYRQPGEEPAPWYAYLLTVLFILGLYAFVQMADAVGF